MSGNSVSAPSVRVGIDVGGTFTDVACTVDGALLHAFKVPSTPTNPANAVLHALNELAGRGVDLSHVNSLAHGTTVATNAVLERKGARIGVLATQGFADTLEIGRQMRRDLYSIRLDPETPVFLAPGERRFGIEERIGPEGAIIQALDETSVRDALDALVTLGVGSIAVSLLFSFVNPTHEERIKEIVQTDYPSLDISLSSEVDPAFREYERTAVTAFDAYIKPVVSRYLADLTEEAKRAGVDAPLQVMQSRGGLAHATVASARPVRLFLSGPAAGVIGGQSEGALVGEEALITLDVGGTSCDIALISSATPLTRSEGVIDGYTVRVPMVDVNAIGAGGGSIAWLDDAGGLRVGPHSAGSSPGPACYGQGGTEPTVTDASIVLGLVNPAFFAGGTLRLDPEAAHSVIRTKIAEPLGLSVEDAAAGIHQVLNAQMAEGIRLVSIGRGFDPREFALVALGGAGPVHACALAEELQIARVVLPRRPGVLSASGLLAAPIEHEAALSFGRTLDGADIADIRARLGLLDARCAELMAAEGQFEQPIEAEYFADVCYVGQSYYLEIPLEPGDSAPLERLYERFLEAHDRIYGHAVEGAARFVNLRAVHRVHPASATPGQHDGQTGPDGDVAPTSRSVRIPGTSERTTAAIYQRDALRPGTEFTGPAVIEQTDTTTVVSPGWRATISDNHVITLRNDAS